MEISANNLRLLEPTAPENLVPSSWWWVWVAIIATIGCVAALIWWIRHRKHAPSRRAPNTKAIAFAEAVAALTQLPPRNPRETATSVSLILRRYLARITDDPALYETHEEFIARHDALAGLPTEARNHTATTFSHLASLKYAPTTLTEEPTDIINQAKQLLRILNSAPAG